MNPTYKRGKKKSNKLLIAIAVIIILVALIIFAEIYTQHMYIILMHNKIRFSFE